MFSSEATLWVLHLYHHQIVTLLAASLGSQWTLNLLRVFILGQYLLWNYPRSDRRTNILPKFPWGILRTASRGGPCYWYSNRETEKSYEPVISCKSKKNNILCFLSSLTTYNGHVWMFLPVCSGDSWYGDQIRQHFTVPLDLTSGSVFATACELVSDNSVFRYISDFDLVKVGTKLWNSGMRTVATRIAIREVCWTCENFLQQGCELQVRRILKDIVDELWY